MADNIEAKRKQVAEQYRVVVHLANALACVHQDLIPLIQDGCGDELLDLRGERSARIMEVLGDILNGMDAVTEEDNWTAPIFDGAHKRWPPMGVR
jgi:hypothetical protein